MSTRDNRFFLVVYDIADSTRLRRVARRMESAGTRVQDSVFHCRLTPSDHEALVKDLTALINIESDKISLYPVCTKDLPDVEFVGKVLPNNSMAQGYAIV
jgi:CRISPR-associated protein Cas2